MDSYANQQKLEVFTYSKVTGMNKHFTVDGVTYLLTISDLGDISFGAVHGATKRGRVVRELFFEEFDIFDDIDILTNPLKVFLTVGNMVVDWVWANRPHMFGVVSSTKRKIRIYRYLSERFLKKLNGYFLIEYPAGTFCFYKWKERRPSS